MDAKEKAAIVVAAIITMILAFYPRESPESKIVLDHSNDGRD